MTGIYERHAVADLTGPRITLTDEPDQLCGDEAVPAAILRSADFNCPTCGDPMSLFFGCGICEPISE